MSPPKFFIYLRSVFQFGFALSCTLTWSHRPNEVSVRSLAGLGENVAATSGRVQLGFCYRRTPALVTIVMQLYEHIRRLPSHGSLLPRSCLRLVLNLKLGFTFGIMLPVSDYWN